MTNFNFNFDQTNNVTSTTSNKYFTPGIHEATFKGVKKTVTTINGVETTVMDLLFVGENDEQYNHRMFAPTSDERKSNQYGGLNASQLDQFMWSCRHIINALNPTLGAGMEKGTNKFSPKNFEDVIVLMTKATEKAIGTKIQIKLIPNKQYTQFPPFPATLSRPDEDGNVVLKKATDFIGKDLTLTPKEADAIANAKNAKPTSMNKTKDMDGLGDDFKIDETEDDLPF